MSKIHRTLFLSTAMCIAVSVTVNADIIETIGAASKINAPSDVRQGQLEHNSQIVVFPEQAGVKLLAPIKVDISKPGTSPTVVKRQGPKGRPKPSKVNKRLSPFTIVRGREIDSYLIHFDPVGEADAHHTASGSVTFARDVLGLIVTADKLNATHAFPGLTNTTYPGGMAQDIEFDKEGTSITLSEDRRTLTFTLVASTASDNIRVITEADTSGNDPDAPKLKKKKASSQNTKRNMEKPVQQSTDLLQAPSLWSGTRTLTNRGKTFNCQLKVDSRNGDLFTIIYSEHHSAIRLAMQFRLSGRALIFQGYKNNSVADFTIENLQAQGSTDGQGMEIGYRWIQSGKGYQNALVEGNILVTRDK